MKEKVSTLQDRSKFCWAMTLEIGHDKVTVAFVVLEVDIGDLNKATEMTTDKDITPATAIER